MTDTKSLLMGAVPGVALAVLLVFAVPGSALVGSNVMTDSVGPHGYVTVSVVRDGQEIYHHEDHNDITVDGFDFIAQQISGNTLGTGSNPVTTGANWIALTSTNIDPTTLAASAGAVLTDEIADGNGLDRAQGVYAHTNDTASLTITETFAATGAYTAVQGAGLFTADVTGTPGSGGDDGTMVAVNEFTSVTLASGDQLTITWTLSLS